MNKKVIAIGVAGILLANLILFALQKISNLIFWTVILAAAAFTYITFPKK